MTQIDQTYENACAIVRASGKASISYLQGMMFIGYNRAARYIEEMEADGIVTPADYSGKREIIMNNASQNQLWPKPKK